MKELFAEGERIITAICEGSKYNQKILELANEPEKLILYISLNKPAESLLDNLRFEGIDTNNIWIIDVITKMMKKPVEINNVYYCSIGENLDELNITINNFLKYDFDYLVIDSMNPLLIRLDQEEVKQFISSLFAKLRERGLKSLIIVSNSKYQIEQIERLESLSDKSIKL